MEKRILIFSLYFVLLTFMSSIMPELQVYRELLKNDLLKLGYSSEHIDLAIKYKFDKENIIKMFQIL